jgi:hypothetical protein
MATNNDSDNTEQHGKMTVQEAGHEGGQKVKRLIEEGKEKEAETGSSARSGQSETFGERAGHREQRDGGSGEARS